MGIISYYVLLDPILLCLFVHRHPALGWFMRMMMITAHSTTSWQRNTCIINFFFYSRYFTHTHSYDPPLGLERTAEFRAGQGSRQRVLAYRNQILCVFLLDDSVGESTQDKGNRLIALWDKRLAILHEPSGEGEANLLAPHWQVVRNRVLDDFQQLHRSVSSADAELVQQLDCGGEEERCQL